MVSFFWLEIWIGFFIVMALVSVAILTSSLRPIPKVADDNDALKITKEALDNESVERYEVVSIITRDDTDITTVIVTTGFSDIALDIDNKSGRVISKDRVAKYT